MLNVLGEKRKESPVETKQTKPKYDWRYENSLISGKVPLEIAGDYSQWRTNSVLSAHRDLIGKVNEMNMHHGITDKMHYAFLFGSIRKEKRYSKTETKEEKKARENKEALIASVAEYYKYNTIRAKEVLKILTPEQLEKIIKGKEKGGVK